MSASPVRAAQPTLKSQLTPFTASRLLSEWHRLGVIKKSRGKLLLRAPERLFMMKSESITTVR